jgi:hypothetical protein
MDGVCGETVAREAASGGVGGVARGGASPARGRPLYAVTATQRVASPMLGPRADDEMRCGWFSSPQLCQHSSHSKTVLAGDQRQRWRRLPRLAGPAWCTGRPLSRPTCIGQQAGLGQRAVCSWRRRAFLLKEKVQGGNMGVAHMYLQYSKHSKLGASPSHETPESV